MKRIISLMLSLLFLVFVSTGCSKPQSEDPKTDPTTSVLNPTFSAMPQKTQPLAEVYHINENVALFKFITPGMDSSLTELVCYDISSDSLLGELDLGEGWIDVFTLDSGFAVLDYNNKTYTVYNNACLEKSVISLAFDGNIGSAALNGDSLLLSDLRTGYYYIYDLTANTSVPVDKTISASEYTWAGNHNEAFLIYSYNGRMFTITADGKTKFVTATAQSVQEVGDTYILGVVGDYAVFRSLTGVAAEMLPLRGSMENFFSSFGNGFLSSSNDDTNALHYYDLNRRTVADYEVSGYVMHASLWGTAAVMVMYDEQAGFTYDYVDFASLSAVGIDAATYDKTVIDNLRPLPEISGVATEILDVYGITVIDEHDFFDMEPYGFTITAADKQQVADRTEQLRDFLAYFPDGIFKELNTKAPVVIVLCNELGGNAGGLNTLIDGYNVSFLSVTGNREYFNGVAAHELAHAIERGVSLSDLDAWTAMQPAPVQSAYGNLSLTVEYTADDKGKTPVWFTDAYGRTNAMEDRATVFEDMYDAYVTGDVSALNYDGLKQKVDFWSHMLRNNFVCCADATFPWDSLFK